jgi:glycerophosphoryl diester phosphodiesterase
MNRCPLKLARPLTLARLLALLITALLAAQFGGCAAAPMLIGHRGAPGYRPEHTLASYALAIEQGADFIEPDLVITRDGVLVCRHENEISGTTDVARRPEFASRKTTKTIDGTPVTGWFTEDFFLAELKTLRATERIPKVRPDNVQYNGQFEVPTLAEVISLVRSSEARTGRTIGLYPETKHPTYFRGIGLPLEERLVYLLTASGYSGRNAPIFIQSFEVSNLRHLRTLTDLPLVQLLGYGGQPYDFTVASDPRTYADLVTPAGLKFISTYADVAGANKLHIIPCDASGKLMAPTSFVADARAAGLRVHLWTLRADNSFLPADYKNNALGEFRAYLSTGIDGFFTDQPDIGRAAAKSR